ncbi:MAG: DUF6320 domain-containing protein [Eubacteriales bacterium]
MPYCVNCGVELSAYHKKCPLCKTEVLHESAYEPTDNTDYPDYRINTVSEKKRIRRIITGGILTVQCIIYSIITLFIDVLTSRGLHWSLIVLASLALVWFGVAYPFFRKRNTFFRLFSYDCLAVLIYLVVLNIITSGRISWSQYTTFAMVVVWLIASGIFLTDRIRRFLPITIYYILAALIIGVGVVVLIGTQPLTIKIASAIGLPLLIISLLSYFVIRSSKNGVWGLVTVVLADVAIMSLVTDVVVGYFLTGQVKANWSLIVCVVIIPCVLMLSGIKRSTELKSLVAKKLHRR